MKLTGHSSADMNSVYSHHELQTIRTAPDCSPDAAKVAESVEAIIRWVPGEIMSALKIEQRL
jgi:hypothetical protein